ncbi:MAG: hypothetical protein ABL904_26315 [Hyphomicrobiaceae bacterium]
MTTASWMTKYGKRRVRHEPPTLEEALSAAEGLSDEPAQQIALAAELMQLPVEAVRSEAERILRARGGRISQIQMITGRRTPTAVVVERKPARRVMTNPLAKPASRRVVV